MPSNEEEIQHLREIERSIVNDLQNANQILEIVKALNNEDFHKDVRSAAVHCLRRIFLELAENEMIKKGKNEYYSVKSTKKNSKNVKVYEWFVKKYQEVQTLFCQLISNESTAWCHALVIRTYLELLKIDHKIYENSSPLEHIVPETNFALSSYRQFLTTLITAPFELDVDLLIMMKDEVFIYHDCLYFGYYLLHEILNECKEESNELQVERQILYLTDITKKKKAEIKKIEEEKSQFSTKEKAFQLKKKNLLDLLRMMPISKEMFDEDDDDDENNESSKYWITFEKKTEYTNDNDSDSEAEVEEEKKIIENQQMTLAKQKKALLGKRKFTTTTATTTSNITTNNNNNEKKQLKKDFQYQLQHYTFYQKLFSKSWILLLSLTWSITEHKLLLTHLSTYVMKQLINPLLLSDYLTECYSFGGIIAILSLENLLTLIISYNLDYPKFFESLYSLCNILIFQSKYSYKYLSLLSLCLKSSNIPEIMIFSFIKRLSYIALHIPCNKVIYCIYQMIWLLKQYKNTQQLIHKKKFSNKKNQEEGEEEDGEEEREDDVEEQPKKKSKKNEEVSKKQQEKIKTTNGFVLEEEKDLMENHVKESSLYELEMLEHHYLYKYIAEVASTIRNPETTSIHAIPIEMKEYHNISLQSLIDKEFDEMKKNNYSNCELAFQKPTQLFA